MYLNKTACQNLLWFPIIREKIPRKSIFSGLPEYPLNREFLKLCNCIRSSVQLIGKFSSFPEYHRVRRVRVFLASVTSADAFPFIIAWHFAAPSGSAKREKLQTLASNNRSCSSLGTSFLSQRGIHERTPRVFYFLSQLGR